MNLAFLCLHVLSGPSVPTHAGEGASSSLSLPTALFWKQPHRLTQKSRFVEYLTSGHLTLTMSGGDHPALFSDPTHRAGLGGSDEAGGHLSSGLYDMAGPYHSPRHSVPPQHRPICPQCLRYPCRAHGGGCYDTSECFQPSTCRLL